MKNLIILLSILVLFGAGCGKEDDLCWTITKDFVNEKVLTKECLQKQIDDLKEKDALDQKITILLAKPKQTVYFCMGDEDCNKKKKENVKTEIPIREFLELLAKDYKYVPETTETKEARLIKIK